MLFFVSVTVVFEGETSGGTPERAGGAEKGEPVEDASVVCVLCCQHFVSTRRRVYEGPFMRESRRQGIQLGGMEGM